MGWLWMITEKEIKEWLLEEFSDTELKIIFEEK